MASVQPLPRRASRAVSYICAPIAVWFLLPLIALMLQACASIERLAIPERTLLDPRYQAVGRQTGVDHSVWDEFVQSHTRRDAQGVVRVRYAEIPSEDREALQNYIRALSVLDINRFSRDSQLAYWVNLYNATTVEVILAHYPVDSIRAITDGFFDLGPWDDKRLNVNGQALSLHDIEHRIIRPLWQDEPNIHYLLNCASVGCPNLAQTAYTDDTIQTRLDQAARVYVNDPRGVTVGDDGQLVGSKIYNWYRDDFGGSERRVLAHLRQHADAELKAVLDERDGIDRYVYDWSLNDTATVER